MSAARIFRPVLWAATAVGVLSVAGLVSAAVAAGTNRLHVMARPGATTSKAGAETILASYSGRWGRQLVVEMKGQKLSLFEFSRDSPGQSACYGKCSKTWYALIARGKIVVRGTGVSKKHLRTFRRRDGSRQIEYWGQPLYRCYRNTKTGQDDGTNEYRFGGSWGLVGSQGSPVPPDAADAYGGPPPPNC